MITPVVGGSRARGALLLVDISGYSGFLQGVADAHRDLIVEADVPPPAYAVLSSLLDAMVTVISPPFRLVKFEGDAIFAVAGPNDLPTGHAVLACLRSCYETFQARLGEAGAQWTCSCSACSRLGDLGLKFVLHHGDYVVQGIAGRDELLGPEVNVVHRLLKNHARDLVGGRPYALITDAALRALDVPADEMLAAEERYEHMAPIAVHVLPLAAERPTGS